MVKIVTCYVVCKIICSYFAKMQFWKLISNLCMHELQQKSILPRKCFHQMQTYFCHNYNSSRNSGLNFEIQLHDSKFFLIRRCIFSIVQGVSKRWTQSGIIISLKFGPSFWKTLECITVAIQLSYGLLVTINILLNIQWAPRAVDF